MWVFSSLRLKHHYYLFTKYIITISLQSKSFIAFSSLKLSNCLKIGNPYFSIVAIYEIPTHKGRNKVQCNLQLELLPLINEKMEEYFT